MQTEMLVILARLVLAIKDGDNVKNRDDRYVLQEAAFHLEQYAAMLDQTPSLPSRREAASAFK